MGQGMTPRRAALIAVMITFFGEIVFWLWLLIRGWRIPERMDPGPIPARR